MILKLRLESRIHLVRTIHLLLHYTKNLNVTLYLSVMYDSNAKYVSHEIRDLNGIHDPYDYVYMMSNYEMYVNYVKVPGTFTKVHGSYLLNIFR